MLFRPKVILILLLMEPEIDLALLGFGVNASSHEFVELVSQGVVEVGRSWH